MIHQESLVRHQMDQLWQVHEDTMSVNAQQHREIVAVQQKVVDLTKQQVSE